ncbi:MAG: DNA translocase FtsK, partial [Planctomycetota bacterium]
APARAPARRRARTPRRRPRPLLRREAGTYVFPPTALLDAGQAHDPAAVREEVEENGRILGEALGSFGVDATVVSSERGPVITFYEIAIASGVRLNRVTALADDLAIALKAPSVRIVAPIPGRNTVGVEVPNLTREAVVFRDLIEESSDLAERRLLPIYLGRDTAGRPQIEDLATMPHLLIAGATGSGKSVCINSVLLSIIYTRTPTDVSLILIDPKQVELSFFEGTPHLITPVVTDMKRAAKILEWAVDRMEERYGLLLAGGVRNIAAYNALSKENLAAARERTGLSEEEAPEHLPQIVIVVDELADLMMTSGKDVELAITRLAQKSRAVGIHIILATQRPSTNVITGLIKANMPTRIAFCVSSKIDSRVILDANGAEKLLGMGDMLFMNPRSLHLRRAQGTLVTDAEVRQVVDFLKEQCPAPELQDLLQQQRRGQGNPMEEDDLYEDAVRVVLTSRLGSASMLQRRMSIGYTRASRLIDMMCDHGVVGPHVGSKAREVLFTLEEWEAQQAEGGAGGGSPSSYADEDYETQDESWEG